MSVAELLFPNAYDRRTDRIIAAAQAAHEKNLRCDLRVRWAHACERPALQLSHGLATSVGMGPGRAPLIREITIGDAATPTRFIVELRPGQVLEDLEDAGRELAAALYAHRLMFEPIGGAHVRVTIVEDDPHAGVVEAVDTVPGMITLGPDENGHPVRFTPAELLPWAIQGASGSGKSTALYWIMRQIITMPGARLAGVDPSGLIFRPLPPDPLRISGLRDPEAIVSVLGSLVDEMDARTERIPWDADALPCGPGEADPWLFIVIEELPGLLAALDAINTKLGKEARAYIGRLAAESRKTGGRLILVAQRHDAASSGGAVVRSNCGFRVSFKVENRTAVEFLHEGCSPDLADDHTHAAPGVALVTSPGEAVRRVRFPVMTYREWAQAARAATAVPADDEALVPVAVAA